LEGAVTLAEQESCRVVLLVGNQQIELSRSAEVGGDNR
jgi:hypothetical protein